MPIHKALDNFFLVDLDLPRRGFTRFISCWIIKEGDRGMVIDPGPSASITTLLNALKEIGIRMIDFILLTHIHLDHAGACGALAKSYPDANVVCHPQAVAHLADPGNLWKGSLKVLGDLAKAYGKPDPVNREQLFTETTIRWKGTTIHSVETPGHASHHLCFFSEDLVFAGEVAGVTVPSLNKPYLRPATPVPFRPEIALNSIALVTERKPEKICYGHYGLRDDAGSMLKMAREQVQFWVTLMEERQSKGMAPDEEEIFAEILATDPCVSSFYEMDPDKREREAYFMKNSIKGMLKYLDGKA